MAKIDKIYEEVDDFGLITSAEAKALGMSNAEMVQQCAKGKLVRVARGVYCMPIWPYQKEAPYAVAVKAAGPGAFLYGASVVALLELAPTDPKKKWIGVTKRTRRSIGPATKLVVAKDVVPVVLEGVPCQPVAEAILAAKAHLEPKRALDAVARARERGFITQAEADALTAQLQDR